MIWQYFAEATTDSIISSSYAQWGAIGVLGVLVTFVIVYLYRDNKGLRATISALQDARLKDAKDFAAIQAAPADELLKFVRALYDGFNDRARRK